MNLKKIRLLADKTQKQTADDLKITQNTYSNYENQKTAPDIETLIKLADYFHTTIDNICGHEVPYLLDKSALSEKQRELVEYARTMTEEECRLTLAYIEGTRAGIKEREIKINNLKG